MCSKTLCLPLVLVNKVLLVVRCGNFAGSVVLRRPARDSNLVQPLSVTQAWMTKACLALYKYRILPVNSLVPLVATWVDVAIYKDI